MIPNIIANTADLNSITVEAVTAGVFLYNYHAINDFGCEFDSTVTITVEDNLLISAGDDTTMCAGVPVIIGPGAAGGGSSCDYTLVLADQWGDGWNGSSINVTTAAGTSNYAGPPVDTITIPLTVTNGDNITLQFMPVGFSSNQCSIFLYAADGTLVYTNGAVGNPTPLPQTVIANCYLGYVFEWTPLNGTLTTPTDINPLANPAVNTIYTLTTYPVGHPDCFVTDDIEVTIGVFLDPGSDSTIILCEDAPPADLFNYLGGAPNDRW